MSAYIFSKYRKIAVITALLLIAFLLTFLSACGGEETVTVTLYTADGRATETVSSSRGLAYIFPDCEREGYTFLGWQAGDRVYQPEDKLTLDGDISATAKWRPYAATLDFVGVDIPALEISHEESKSLPVPNLAGYRFLGYRLPSGESFTDASGEMLKPYSAKEDGERVEISAIFEPIEYEIRYIGLKEAVNLNPAVYSAEDGALVLIDPALRWYDFVGWFLDEECAERVTELSAVANGAVTLYAAWEKSTYTATYYVDTEPLSAVKFDIENREWTDPPVPERAHYVGAWSDYTVTDGDISINALYTPIDYTVSLNPAEGVLDSGELFYNAESPDAPLPVPDRRGYSFLGWYNASGERITDVGGERIYGNLALTARWEAVEYTVIYENISHVVGLDLPKSYTVEDGDIHLPVIEQEGFTFLGWLVNGSSADKISTSLATDLTVKALLDGDKHEVALHSSYGELSVRAVSVEYGSPYTLPVPKAEGRCFLGWYSSAADGAVLYAGADGRSVSDYLDHGSRMLFALWGDEMHRVEYKTEGGELICVTELAHGALFDPSVKVTAPEGCVLEGWFTSGGDRLTSSSVVLGDTVACARFVESTPIGSAAELEAMRLAPDGRYHLLRDIDLKGEEWTPFAFGGTLLGGGYEIKNFILKYNNVSNFGFFTVNNGTVEDLCLSDFVFAVATSMDVEVAVGVLVGANNGSLRGCSIADCSVSVDFTARVSCSGFCFGLIAGVSRGEISGCSSSSSIVMNIIGSASGNNRQVTAFCIGGLVGKSEGRLSGLYYGGAITVRSMAISSWNGNQQSYTRVGGVVGYSLDSLSESYSDATLDYATTALTNDHGVDLDDVRIGVLAGTNSGTLSSSFSRGVLKLRSLCDSYAGGLVGLNAEGGAVKNCYSTSELETSGAHVGGLVGYSIGKITYSYSASVITASGRGDVGGFVGYTEPYSTIMNCYSASKISAGNTNAGAFFGSYRGAALKCYYSAGVLLTVAGSYPAQESFDPVAERVNIDILRNESLREMGWEDSWTILSGFDPMLPWEVSIEHNYETHTVPPTCESYGYILWRCVDCGLHFAKDLINPHGHNFGGSGRVVAPTCTSEGYTVRECYYCTETAIFDRKAALSHLEGERIADKCLSPSCTDDGVECFLCSREGCGVEYFNTLPALGHKGRITLDRLLPTCSRLDDGNGGYAYITEDGHTEEISCSVCFAVLVESEVIPAHLMTEREITPAGCLTEGVCDRVCGLCGFEERGVILPPLGHSDPDSDLRCNICDGLTGDYGSDAFISITTEEGLRAIADDLDGKYRLDADITLSAPWIPIGSESAPFCGVLYGGGHKIIGLNLVAYEDGEYGLFGYSEGVIDGVRLDGMTVDIFNANVTIGGIAAINSGIIANCTVSGEVTVGFSMSAYMKDYAPHKYSYIQEVGLLAGINLGDGAVVKCELSAGVTVTATSRAMIWSESLWYRWIYREYESTALTTELSAVFGGAVAVNYGRISDTHLTGSLVLNNTMPRGEIVDNFGYLSSTLDFTAGAIAGVDLGGLTDCSGGDRVTFAKWANEISSPYSGRWACYSEFVLHVFVEEDMLVGSRKKL